MTTFERITLILLLPALLGGLGCTLPGRWAEPAPPEADDLAYLRLAAVMQRQAYPECVTGRFVSLCDFETSPELDADRGREQTQLFSTTPAGAATVQLVTTETATGAGAGRIELPSRAALLFRPPLVRDVRPYTLLSLAVHSPTVRDDLVVTLASPEGAWTSGPQLIDAGWSTVQIDLARLADHDTLDLSDIRAIELRLTAAETPVTLGIDDILLIDNRRAIDAPDGVTCRKEGLDYTIDLPGWAEPLRLAAGRDGLWRLGDHQAALRAVAPRSGPAGEGESLDAMGLRRLGRVELLEANAVRLRLRSTWYVSPAAGDWIDLTVPHVRWDYTFYGDGRYVTDVTVNNAGGPPLLRVEIDTPVDVAMDLGHTGRELPRDRFVDPIGRWAYLAAPPGPQRRTLLANFAEPPLRRVVMGSQAPADSQAGAGGFDVYQGCYTAAARGGHCRVVFLSGYAGLVRPVLFVRGPWRGAVQANCLGRALRTARTDEGALIWIDETLAGDVLVEVTGPIGALDQ